jgi:hypothetical protein
MLTKNLPEQLDLTVNYGEESAGGIEHHWVRDMILTAHHFMPGPRPLHSVLDPGRISIRNFDAATVEIKFESHPAGAEMTFDVPYTVCRLRKFRTASQAGHFYNSAHRAFSQGAHMRPMGDFKGLAIKNWAWRLSVNHIHAGNESDIAGFSLAVLRGRLTYFLVVGGLALSDKDDLDVCALPSILLAANWAE